MLLNLKESIFLVIFVITTGYTFLVGWKVMLFLSVPKDIDELDSESEIKTRLPAIIYDLLLIAVFLFLNSVMEAAIRELFKTTGWDGAVYVLITCLGLKVRSSGCGMCLFTLIVFVFSMF